MALPLAYVIAGRLGLMLAVSPGYATAVFLPAGIAVAAAFMMGASSLPGILLGSFVLNVWIGYSLGRDVDAISLATAAMIAARLATGNRLSGAVRQSARSPALFAACAAILPHQRNSATGSGVLFVALRMGSFAQAAQSILGLR